MEPEIRATHPAPALGDPSAAPAPRTFARRIDCGDAPKLPAAVPVQPAGADGKPGTGEGA